MYFGPPPSIIETEVYATLPDQFRAGAAHEKKRGSFLEGPSFDRAGNLYCVDISLRARLPHLPRGAWDVVAEYDGEPNGLKIHRDGRIFIADHRNGILLLDPGEGRRRRRSSQGPPASASRASTISSSRRTAISISPTRARPACMTPPAGSTATRPPASSTA